MLNKLDKRRPNLIRIIAIIPVPKLFRAHSHPIMFMAKETKIITIIMKEYGLAILATVFGTCHLEKKK